MQGTALIFSKTTVKAKEAAGSARHPFWMSTVRKARAAACCSGYSQSRAGSRLQRTKGASVCTQDPPPEALCLGGPHPKMIFFPFCNNASNTLLRGPF